jgi:hypothetical protein
MDPDADGAIVERIAEWLPDCDEPLAWIAEATGTTYPIVERIAEWLPDCDEPLAWTAEATGTTYPVSDTNQQVPERLG